MATVGLLLGAQALVEGVPIAAAQTTCNPGGSSHWYARATSGTGTTNGTEIAANIPANFYAPAGTTDDEAVWLVDWNTLGSPDSGVELGWFNSVWPYDGQYQGMFFTGATGYMTIDGGGASNSGTVLTSMGAIQSSTQVWFQILNAAPGQLLYIAIMGYYTAYDQGYYVNSPRTNLSQGEVTVTPGAWMGGNSGGGTTQWGYFENYSNNQVAPWGAFTMCDNTPYWIVSKSSYSWKNGGK